MLTTSNILSSAINNKVSPDLQHGTETCIGGSQTFSCYNGNSWLLKVADRLPVNMAKTSLRKICCNFCEWGTMNTDSHKRRGPEQVIKQEDHGPHREMF